MIRKILFAVLSLQFCLMTVACDKLCKKTVEDVVNIQNLTGRQLSLSICKGRAYGEAQITIPQSATMNEISLGSREESEVVGGTGASCSGVSGGGKITLGITLSPQSFGQVKLCFDDIHNANVLVDNYQLCPTGYMEQTSTANCQ